ncbi:MarR family winged helix-turn-helix transcriptional regulator [Phaeovulum sp. W22_SRMD_FR3]|uniref:MarR family winged helix-turn-helix transcriptional regulator n=1 Tax=Phaeovulum sp. W22_SRMD_FR3 TaxID=3240274 RepID=UPI003F94A259
MDQTLPLETQLCFALYSASHAMTRVYKPLLEGMGLTYPQYLVMLALWEPPAAAAPAVGQTVGQLGARLHLESNTLTPLLKRLETVGLIHRQRDAQDERQVRIVLSAAGEGLRAQAATIPACIQTATGLDLTALRQLQADIAALRDRLGAA